MDKLEKLMKIMEQEQEASDVFAESLEATQENLRKRGLEFSLDELSAIVKGVVESTQENSKELEESDLEMVVGGTYKGYEADCYKWGKKIGKAMVWAMSAAIQLYKLI